MFENISLEDQRLQYEFITERAKKVGKLFGCISVAFVALIGLIVLFSGNATVGTIIGIAAIVIIDYIVCYHMGKCYPWAYYWLLTKFETPLPLIVTLFLGFYIGLALRIKYHGFGKKLHAQR